LGGAGPDGQWRHEIVRDLEEEGFELRQFGRGQFSWTAARRPSLSPSISRSVARSVDRRLSSLANTRCHLPIVLRSRREVLRRTSPRVQTSGNYRRGDMDSGKNPTWARAGTRAATPAAAENGEQGLKSTEFHFVAIVGQLSGNGFSRGRAVESARCLMVFVDLEVRLRGRERLAAVQDLSA